MKSERSIRGLACRWCVVAVLALLCSPLGASEAQAQVQTFFVNVPAASEQRDAMEVCRDRFTAALVRVGGFLANQDAVTQQSVTDCLGETASATAKRECEVSIANIEVDFLIVPTVRRLGTSWNWTLKALVPAQAARQVWGGDELSNEAGSASAAYATCDRLARDFACSQGMAQACSGSAPVAESKAASSYVVGQVIDATSKSPLEDARIRYLEAGFSDQLTGQDGKFRSMDLPVGSKVTIQVAASGFLARSMRMTVAATPVFGVIELVREPAVVPVSPISNPELVGRPSISPARGSGSQCPAGYVRLKSPGTSLSSSTELTERNPARISSAEKIEPDVCIKATEVTQGEWQAIMGSNPSKFLACGSTCPVERVSWEDALQYADALSRSEGLTACYSDAAALDSDCAGYRLPSAEEWEFAAQLESTLAEVQSVDTLGWYENNSAGSVHPTGKKRPNPLGLYDMLGNVREWTSYRPPEQSADGISAGEGGRSARFVASRGGSWRLRDPFSRPSSPESLVRGYRSDDVGFRLVRILRPAAAARRCLQQFEAKAFAAAAVTCSKAATEDGDDHESLLKLGQSFYELGRPSEAVGPLERAIRLNRKNASAWLTLGAARQEVGDVPGARDAYERFLELNPNSRWANAVRTILQGL